MYTQYVAPRSAAAQRPSSFFSDRPMMDVSWPISRSRMADGGNALRPRARRPARVRGDCAMLGVVVTVRRELLVAPRGCVDFRRSVCCFSRGPQTGVQATFWMYVLSLAVCASGGWFARFSVWLPGSECVDIAA